MARAHIQSTEAKCKTTSDFEWLQIQAFPAGQKLGPLNRLLWKSTARTIYTGADGVESVAQHGEAA